jgi:2-dehydro-3-deoxyphosphogluconate aldolase / (4S)-4-hydroxy-2-oxoglutarate aldolase
MDHMSRREEAIYLTKSTGVLPAIKLKNTADLLPVAEAMIKGGIRVHEVTMTTPGVLEAFRAIKNAFGDQLHLASGTTLDAAAAYAAIQAGVSIVVSPATIPAVIETAHRYQVACYAGAYTATEVLQVMTLGASMVKIFPASLAGPKYMTNLRMVYPDLNIIPSGGIGLDTAAEYIRCGACAISGARNFYDPEAVAQYGMGWVTEQAQKYIALAAEAKRTPYPLP